MTATPRGTQRVMLCVCLCSCLAHWTCSAVCFCCVVSLCCIVIQTEAYFALLSGWGKTKTRPFPVYVHVCVCLLLSVGEEAGRDEPGAGHYCPLERVREKTDLDDVTLQQRHHWGFFKVHFDTLQWICGLVFTVVGGRSHTGSSSSRTVKVCWRLSPCLPVSSRVSLLSQSHLRHAHKDNVSRFLSHLGSVFPPHGINLSLRIVASLCLLDISPPCSRSLFSRPLCLFSIFLFSCSPSAYVLIVSLIEVWWTALHPLELDAWSVHSLIIWRADSTDILCLNKALFHLQGFGNVLALVPFWNAWKEGIFFS